ncbi:succinylglutamate desuccinylase/aspartoacylase family protein [Castellaniella sp. UC4442_H9]
MALIEVIMGKISVLNEYRDVGRSVVSVPITETSSGHRLAATIHIVRGKHDGPTMVVAGGMHGDEFGSFPVIRNFLDSLVPENMKGTVVALPVANPLALGMMSRFTPDMHGNTDLHAAFPGAEKGTLTQKIAAAIDASIIDGLTADDLFVDIHSGGAGGRLQFRVDYDNKLKEDLKSRVVELCRAFGTYLIHENNLAGTSSRLANSRGVPTVNVEVGGSYLDEPAEAEFTEKGVRGLHSLASFIGIVDGTPLYRPEQWVYDTANRIEVNPKAGGYLVSRKPDITDLDQLIARGTLLGEVVNPYTLEVVDQLTAPVDGFLFFTRRSGIVEAGAKVYGLAQHSGAVCLR